MRKAMTNAAPVLLMAAAAAAPHAAAAGPLDFQPFMVAISVADMEAETAFYVDKLGFTIEKDAEMRGGAVHFRWLTNGMQRIELVSSQGSKKGGDRPAPPGHAAVQGLVHFTLQTEDIEATRAALAAKGVTPVLDITEVAPLGIRVMYLQDPEGNPVEIAQPVAAG